MCFILLGNSEECTNELSFSTNTISKLSRFIIKKYLQCTVGQHYRRRFGGGIFPLAMSLLRLLWFEPRCPRWSCLDFFAAPRFGGLSIRLLPLPPPSRLGFQFGTVRPLSTSTRILRPCTLRPSACLYAFFTASSDSNSMDAYPRGFSGASCIQTAPGGVRTFPINCTMHHLPSSEWVICSSGVQMPGSNQESRL